MIKDLIIRNRSYRRFDQSVKIPTKQIYEWIELVRYAASGRNLQPLKYIVCNNEKTNESIFSTLGWAGYLKQWEGPAEGEKPVAYIVVLHDKIISEKYYCDDGIAMQNILLGAVSSGYGGCILGTFNKDKIRGLMDIPEKFEILWIIALGKPAETVIIEDMDDNHFEYWRDEEDNHRVPKRELKELIVKTLN